MAHEDRRVMKTARVSPFVSKLYDILSDEQNRDIIGWDPQGVGFVIKSVAEFESKIIKHHFKHKTITSFFRQLNLYDFERTSDGRKTRGKPGMGQCSFRHKHFTPCSPDALHLVRRQHKKKQPTPTFEPNTTWQNGMANVANFQHPQRAEYQATPMANEWQPPTPKGYSQTTWVTSPEPTNEWAASPAYLPQRVMAFPPQYTMPSTGFDKPWPSTGPVYGTDTGYYQPPFIPLPGYQTFYAASPPTDPRYQKE